jgi:hypothetical protein
MHSAWPIVGGRKPEAGRQNARSPNCPGRKFDEHARGRDCLAGSIDNVAQTVEELSAFARGKKLVGRHLFLTGLLGPSIVRKRFGR